MKKKAKDISMSHVWASLEVDPRLAKKHYRGDDKPSPDKKSNPKKGRK